jgi:hypothetical protein
MYPPVPTNDPALVQSAVKRDYAAMFPGADPSFVANAFEWTTDCFAGRYGGYQPIDARYHDLEHTMQGTLCLARLLHGRHKAGAQPNLDPRSFQLALLAILLHDTGYLKARDDTDGSGAKYTAIHVDRSADFAARLLGEKGFPQQDIQSVQNMISCTGVNADLGSIPFQGTMESLCGHAVGTADLLGQMAADDYVDRLPELYDEFVEAAEFAEAKSAFVGSFTSAEDLMRKTPAFWEKYVLPKLKGDFEGLYRFLNNPYPNGPNLYVERIEANIERLKQELAAK